MGRKSIAPSGVDLSKAGSFADKKPTMLREGFWHSRDNKDLPKPIDRTGSTPWRHKKEFIKALLELQSRAKKARYKGFSRCRICDKVNGSVTYSYDNWEWPEGYVHYIETHDVIPSLAFTEFVLGRDLGQ